MTMMFEDEDIAVKLGDPLSSFHRQFKEADGVANIRLDLAPEECRIIFGEVSGAGIS